MTKKSFLTTIALFLSVGMFAQSNEPSPLLSVSFSPGFGNGKIYSTNLGSQHGLYNGGNFLFQYHLSENLSVAAGFGILTFNANPISNGEQTAIEMDFLQLPVKVNYITGSKTVKFKAGITGFYNSHLVSVTELGNNKTVEEENLGGNFGVSADLGPVFQISENWRLSIGLEHQFTVSKTTGTQIEIENYMVKFGIQYIISNKK